MNTNINDSNHPTLAIVEPVDEIFEGKKGSSGTLILFRKNDNFFIHWGPTDGSPNQRITAVLEDQKTADFVTESWERGKTLNIDCQKLSKIYLEEPLSITLVKHEEKSVKKRTFNVSDDSFTSLVEFIEQLLVNGIAVPSRPNEKKEEENDEDPSPYVLRFYPKCHKGVFFYTPPYIMLKVDQSTDLAKFWENVHIFFEELIIHLDKSDTLPKDPNFPLAVAARSSHERVKAKILEFQKEQEEKNPKYEKLTAENYKEIFDEEGRIKDEKYFRDRVYTAGIDKEIMPELLPLFVKHCKR